MSRVCPVTGKKTRSGRSYSRRGLAKAKGGVGKKVTGISNRQFKVNLQKTKIWVPELGTSVRVRISAKALRTVTARGAYRTLLDAGLLKAVVHTQKKKGPPHKKAS
jgi:large subunit ribosomal protein L28